LYVEIYYTKNKLSLLMTISKRKFSLLLLLSFSINVIGPGHSFFNTPKVSASLAGDNIIISEVAYDPVAPDQAGEWFELYNPTASTIDISGWTFTDGEGVVTVPALTPAIAPKSFFIATHTAAAGFLRDYPTVSADLSYGSIDVGSLFLANAGD
jgi:hypothetical protein